MSNARKRISDLTALTSASLDTVVVGVDNGTTYKIELDVLADAVTSRVNILDRNRLSSLESVTSSFETKGRSVISSSAQITALGFTSSSVNLSSLNDFTSSQTGLNTAFTNGINGRLTTSSFEAFSSSVHSEILAATNEQSFNGLISGSSQLTSSYDSRYVLSGSITQTTWDNISGKPSGLVSQSTDLTSLNSFTQSIDSRVDNLENATGSYITSLNGTISGSSQLTSSFDTRYSLSGSVQPLPSNLVSSSAQITAFGFVSGSYETTGRGILSSSANLVTTSSFNEYTASISTASLVTSITQLNTYTASVSTASLVTSINNLNSATSSYLTSLSGAISSSSQLTASFDVRYALSGSGGGSTTIPDGTVSGSSQLTASFDTRYSLSGSGGSIPGGTVSGSSQLTASFDTRYLVTGSVTSSINQLNIATASLLIETTNLELFSASVLTRLTTIGVYTSSLNVWTSSVATTGSNQFNGNQVITGSLTITTGSFVASQLLANTSSLYLTSGSNMYVQNNGIVEITGSLLVSGSMSIQSGSITMPDRPAFRVVGTGGGIGAVRTLSGSLYTTDFVQGSGWDVSTGTFTAPIAGLYQVNLVTRTNSNSYASATQFIVYKNNTGGVTGTPQIMIEYGANTSMNHTGGSTISKLAVGDTLKVVLAVGSGSFDSNDNFSVAYIG